MRTDQIAIVPKALYLKSCPHCGTADPYIYMVWDSGGPLERSLDGPGRPWRAYACATCGFALLVAGYSGTSTVTAVDLIIPETKTAHADLPDAARRYLDQAYRTLSAPDAAALMAGSAVDAMLKALGYEKGNVYQRIDEALADNKLTEGMARWAHAVRLGANRPRHADKDQPHISDQEARQSVDFAEALGNFLFVLTARIDRGIEAAEASNATDQ